MVINILPVPTRMILHALCRYLSTTVDGTHPEPVDMENTPLFTGLYTFQVVVWDF